MLPWDLDGAAPQVQALLTGPVNNSTGRAGWLQPEVQGLLLLSHNWPNEQPGTSKWNRNRGSWGGGGDISDLVLNFEVGGTLDSTD